ncbi:MAG: hypothetical protein CR985_00285 [Flavobacteriales bacterium]|nr:MAG: hypothetical protein CR985_00285 [Flavobacteriales bacterium]
MKIIRHLLLLIIVGIALSSCTGDSIELQPQTAISSDLIYTDPAFAEAYLNKVYSAIPHGFNRGWYMLDAATDDAENSYPWPASNTIFNPSNISPDNSPFNGLWFGAYKQIRRLNGFIANYDRLEGNEELVNRLKAEAHFLRGFYYTYLLRTFGGVPIIKNAQQLDDENLLVPRNTEEEVLNFIMEELDKAAQLFEIAEGAASTRGSWAAVKAMEGRILLYQEKYTESAAASKEVLDAQKYQLDLNYQNIFLDDNSPEVIFDVQFKDPDKGHWGNLFNTPKSEGPISGWGGTGPTQNLVDQYEMKATGKKPSEPGSGYDINNPYQGRDPRFYASILYDGAQWKGQTMRFRPGGAEGIATSGDFTRTGYGLKKFMQESRNHRDKSTQHWVFIRLAEVYLNYAEALIESNTDLNLATDAINEVRKRADMPLITEETQAQMRELVRHERRIELVFEEHRFWDIRRWGIAGDNDVLTIYKMKMDENGNLIGNGKEIWETRVWTPRDYLMPIPQDDMDKNKNLVQNPGYE